MSDNKTANNKSQKEKISKIQKFQALAAAIGGIRENIMEISKLRTKYEGPRFYKVEPEPGSSIILTKEENGLVRNFKRKGMWLPIQSYVIEVSKLNPMFDLTPSSCKELAEYLVASLPTEKEPSLFKFKNQDGYAYTVFPWDIKECVLSAGNHPRWDEIKSRMLTNADACEAFLGSLFDLNSYNQQYLYMYGKGGDSKGTTIRLLQNIFGAGFRSETIPRSGEINAFWSRWLRGKRVVSFGDLSCPSFIKTPIFKGLTGGDSVRMEEKGGDSWEEKLNCKFIFASNRQPPIGHEFADRRRIIPVEFKRYVGAVDGGFEEELKKESPAIIGTWLKKYLEITGRKNIPIPVDGECLDYLDSENYAEEDAIIKANFEFDGIAAGRPKRSSRIYVDNETWAEFQRSNGFTKNQLASIKRRILSKYENSVISATKQFPDGHRERVCFGIRFIYEKKTTGGSYRPTISNNFDD